MECDKGLIESNLDALTELANQMEGLRDTVFEMHLRLVGPVIATSTLNEADEEDAVGDTPAIDKMPSVIDAMTKKIDDTHMLLSNINKL